MARGTGSSNFQPTLRSKLAFISRNAVDILPKEQFEKQLSSGKTLKIKLGIDPTAPDIHLGHLVVLKKLRELQDLGHEVVLIIGDFTARVGDPSGRSKTRPVLSEEEIKSNAKTFESQAFKIIKKDQTTVLHNSQWLDMRASELFGLLASSTLAQILERADFSKRYKNGDSISMLEMVYPLLQGFDSYHTKADVEVGGTDQKFNLLLARDIQLYFGSQPQSVLTMPILPGTDGVEKMSKSLNNHIGLADSPKSIFGRVMSIPDQVMPEYYNLVLNQTMPKGEAVKNKRFLAREITSLLHSQDEAMAAEEEFNNLFVKKEIPLDILKGSLPNTKTLHLPQVISENFSISRSQARTLIKGGGVKIDGEAIAKDTLDIDRNLLEGRVMSVGKLRFISFN